MINSIEQALRLIQRTCDFDIISMSNDYTETSTHHIRHRYREVIIVPLIAITENIKFFTNKGARRVVLADNTICFVEKHETIHLCDLEDSIQEIYNINVWDFIKTWYKIEKNMDSMHFVKIWLRKEEQNVAT